MKKAVLFLKIVYNRRCWGRNMNKKLIYYSRIALFLLAVLGVVIELTKSGIGALMYYTVISNIIVVIFLGYLLYLMTYQKNRWNNSNTLRLKGCVMMCIMITCIIYHVMLSPLDKDFYRIENFICHYIVPLWFFIDTLIFDKKPNYKIQDPLLWTSIPLLYLGFALINGLILKWPIPGAKHSPYAYFFLDINMYGWQYVALWCLKIFIGYLVLSYLYYGLKLLLKKRK